MKKNEVTHGSLYNWNRKLLLPLPKYISDSFFSLSLHFFVLFDICTYHEHARILYCVLTTPHRPENNFWLLTAVIFWPMRCSQYAIEVEIQTVFFDLDEILKKQQYRQSSQLQCSFKNVLKLLRLIPESGWYLNEYCFTSDFWGY